MSVRRRLGIGVIGFGWMGQAHSRSYLRIPTLFPERSYDPRVVICADSDASRREQAGASFGFAEVTDDWRRVVEHPNVDVVTVTAPNMLHEALCVAAAEADKHLFCEKPVGGTPEQTVRIAIATRRAGVITGVGYNYRWVPLVLHARSLIDAGRLGALTNYRGWFFTGYGSDALGTLSWRYLQDQGGHGVSSDLLSHVVDLAGVLAGPIVEVIGTHETFVRQRPVPTATGTHFARGQPGDPVGDVTNEDYAAAMVVFASGARGTFETSRSTVGPECQMAFEVLGTGGALAWDLERLNELRVHLVDDDGRAPRGYTTVHSGERYPFHGTFVPGDGNSVGFEDVVTIEDHAFLESVAKGEPHEPGIDAALAYVSFQAAWLRSCESGRWEDVVPLEVPV